ncbi:MAG: hypothetical protein LBD75_05085 [Candidatus Peribacteria bacterium]|jgi:hypothetical protein|nr:hypothetical protein [Candidatus Peribacteria bacterium]
MNAMMGKISELDTQIANLRSRAISELGADAPEYLISSFINVKGRPLEKEKESLEGMYKVLQGDLEYYTEQEEKMWERDYKERQLALQVAKAKKSGGAGSVKNSDYENIMRYIN